jgi:hypothetical protein
MVTHYPHIRGNQGGIMSDEEDVELDENEKPGEGESPTVVAESASETQLLNMPGPVWLAYQLTMAQALGQAEIPLNLLKASHTSLQQFLGLSDTYCSLIADRLKTAPIDSVK